MGAHTLTPVPTTYSGLRMDTSASNVLPSQGIKSHSLLNEAIEKLPARHRCPSVELKRVFVQTVLEMRGANSTLIRSHQPPLQQYRHTVDQWQEVLSHHSLSMHHQTTTEAKSIRSISRGSVTHGMPSAFTFSRPLDFSERPHTTDTSAWSTFPAVTESNT